MAVLFGPVYSWRLGKALGIDLVDGEHKSCSFDCIYCPQGKRSRGASRRRWFVGLSAVECALRSATADEADCVAFTGRGEPTLASNLGEAIDVAKETLGLPVAVLTNSGLLPRDDVKADLAKADVAVCKLDAYDEESFRAINRPLLPYTFSSVRDGLRDFRRGFGGKLVLQVTLVEENLAFAGQLAALAREFLPDEVELNLRTPWWKARTPDGEIELVHGAFADLQAKCLHTDGPSWAQVSDTGHLQASRPSAAVMLMAVAA